MATLERAIQIAVQAHAGAKDRMGNAFILHPLAVMARVRSEREKTVAILHDVVEKSEPPHRWGFEELRAEGFDDEILAALECLTKREGEPYEAFVRRSLANPLARVVKIADLEDNLDLRRTTKVTEEDAGRLNRYRKALAVVTA